MLTNPQTNSVSNEIVIAYPFSQNVDFFISRRVYEANFLKFLCEFATVVKLPEELLKKECDFDPSPDYLFIDINTWGLKFFLLREQGKIRMPFLIYLHAIYGQDAYITSLIPFLKEEDIVVVPSEYAKKVFLRISDKHTVHVIPLALDIELIKEIAGESNKTKSNVLSYMGQIIPEKGIGELLNCMPGIVRKAKNASLDIIGPLSGKYISNKKSVYVVKLQEEAKKLRVSSHIKWLGYVMSDEKYKILSQSDIFINPSLFKIETFGVVNTEAFACGLPVIATRWSAFDEVITHEKDGFLINTKEKGLGFTLDKKQLVLYVTSLLNNRKLLDKMKANAQKSAVRYDYKTVMPKLLELLKTKKRDIKGSWKVLKRKKISDFKDLYCKDWFDLMNSTKINKKTFDEISDWESCFKELNTSDRLRHRIFKYLANK